jgi:hypothetical protein
MGFKSILKMIGLWEPSLKTIDSKIYENRLAWKPPAGFHFFQVLSLENIFKNIK